jgi:predicted secreted protein
MGLTLKAQTLINSDTIITKTIQINESFNLIFESWPSSGLNWNILDKYDSTFVKAIHVKAKLIEGQASKGGKYAQFWSYTGLKKGEITIEYYWGRIWMKEKLKRCTLKIIIN